MLRKLENGYTVIAEKPDDGGGREITGTFVLAVNDQSGYAVWWHRNYDGICFSGEYFPVIAYGTSHDAFIAAFVAWKERNAYY